MNNLKFYLCAMAVAGLVGATANADDTASISGKVTFEGTPPKMKPIDMAKEPTCQKEHNPPELAQNVVTGPSDALQYVVVYISAGEKASQAPGEQVRFDQKGCMYLPHILPIHADQELGRAHLQFLLQ